MWSRFPSAGQSLLALFAIYGDDVSNHLNFKRVQPLADLTRALTPLQAICHVQAHFDQLVIVQCSIDFRENGVGQSRIPRNDHGIQLVCALFQ